MGNNKLILKFSTSSDLDKFTYEHLLNEQFQKIVIIQTDQCETQHKLQLQIQGVKLREYQKLLNQGFESLNASIKEAEPSGFEFYKMKLNFIYNTPFELHFKSKQINGCNKVKYDTLIKQFI
ncbi:unnamed protein product [Paramecium octaurelia]|uniref:Uncharacterized protein n=1 Tax=Paramecium octaurelia TaxID=43137 RepID=A0A8S1U462_PAROT|nr:unnamed protein product [Paramecium octaurelia]